MGGVVSYVVGGGAARDEVDILVRNGSEEQVVVSFLGTNGTPVHPDVIIVPGGVGVLRAPETPNLESDFPWNPLLDHRTLRVTFQPSGDVKTFRTAWLIQGKRKDDVGINKKKMVSQASDPNLLY